MDIGLIDVDGHNWPNLALMKLSAYHKRCGDAVEMCSWARHFVPVEGWKATPTMLYANNGSASKPVGSFHVRSCPEFVEG